VTDFAPDRSANTKTDAEFFAAATGLVNNLENELRRAVPEERGRWRALEIGCGNGRLMRPMSRHFLEIHGVDISGQLVLDAQANLRDVPHASVKLVADAGLADFADASLDFIYSYDFFRYLSSRDAVLGFLREIHRVLKPGGLARLEFTGISGALFSSQELLEFAQAHDFQVLALEGVSTPSLWTTWRKHAAGWSPSAAMVEASSEEHPVVIRRITNASSFEPVAPSRGRFASIALRVENLPPDTGLSHLRVTIGNSLGAVTSIGPVERAGWQQIRVDLPELEATGLLPVQLFWLDEPLSAPATLRVIPPGPLIPRVVSAPLSAENRMVKLTIEEVARPYELEISLGGRPIEDIEKVCTDPRAQRYEVTFRLPEEPGPGLHHIRVGIGRRKLEPVAIQVSR
jgi:ubiquinone/menaquinone biosynthesis C-methylase UbiE